MQLSMENKRLYDYVSIKAFREASYVNARRRGEISERRLSGPGHSNFQYHYLPLILLAEHIDYASQADSEGYLDSYGSECESP
jgi:hypothetical protein